MVTENDQARAVPAPRPDQLGRVVHDGREAGVVCRLPRAARGAAGDGAPWGNAGCGGGGSRLCCPWPSDEGCVPDRPLRRLQQRPHEAVKYSSPVCHGWLVAGCGELGVGGRSVGDGRARDHEFSWFAVQSLLQSIGCGWMNPT